MTIMNMDKNLPIIVDSVSKLSDFSFISVVAGVGVFDGIHIGHRKLIATLMKMSLELFADPIIITFFPHPRHVLGIDRELRLLRDPIDKFKILGELGIKAVVTIPFTEEFSQLDPEHFLEELFDTGNVNLKGICVGKNWRFGRGAIGDIAMMEKFAQRYHFKFKAIEQVKLEGIIVSSSEIRKAIKRGDFKLAERMLSLHYYVSGKIIDSRKGNKGASIELFFKYGVLPERGRCYLVEILNSPKESYGEFKVISDDRGLIYIKDPNLLFKDRNLLIRLKKAL